MEVGDIIKYKGINLLAVKDIYDNCEDCFFKENNISCTEKDTPDCYTKCIKFIEIKSITLKQLIDKLTNISKQLSSCDIPVIYNGINNNITNVNLSQDNNNDYYINII